MCVSIICFFVYRTCSTSLYIEYIDPLEYLRFFLLFG